jgi:peptidyl-tRNA hydrolase
MKKLYVLIRKDMSKSQQAVQAGHAVAEYLLKRPNTKWDNGTLVYL